jgi:hypothetical protein
MSRFNPEELEKCILMFKSGKSSKDIQDYLITKYSLTKRSSTSNFVKAVRKTMGIYKKSIKY